MSSLEIEAQIREIQARKAGIGKQTAENGEGVPLTAAANGAYMDEDIYGSTQSKYEGYVTSIAANDDADADDDDYENTGLMHTKKVPLPAAFLAELTDKDYDPFADRRVPRISDREDQYRAQRRKLMISPERVDPFADGMHTLPYLSRSFFVCFCWCCISLCETNLLLEKVPFILYTTGQYLRGSSGMFAGKGL